MTRPFECVHIYQQLTYHSAGGLIGNRAGLTQLRDAIDVALAHCRADAVTSQCDGEGYILRVLLLEDIEQAPLAYACEQEDSGIDRSQNGDWFSEWLNGTSSAHWAVQPNNQALTEMKQGVPTRES